MFSFVYPGDIITKNMVQKMLRMRPSSSFLFLYFTSKLNLYSSSLLINQSSVRITADLKQAVTLVASWLESTVS